MAHKNSGAVAGENSVIVSQNPARHDAGVAAIFPLILINFVIDNNSHLDILLLSLLWRNRK
jgi:hypothetical protein